MEVLESLEKDIAICKLSSGLLLREDGLGIDSEAIKRYSEQVAEINEDFHPLLIVGGATGEGRGFLKRHGKEYKNSDMQVMASMGTAAVSLAFRDELIKYDISSGQVLANHNQMQAGSVLMQGILNGIIAESNVYNINENDQENLFELKLLTEEERAVREKQIGIDNDPLAAQLTIALIEEIEREGLGEDLGCHLAIFTEVGGFVIGGEVQAEISAAKRKVVYAQCNGKSVTGSGGMRVKVEACFDAFDAGAKSVRIAHPDQNWLNVLKDTGQTGKVTKVVQ